jgi:hypothetical protein
MPTRLMLSGYIDTVNICSHSGLQPRSSHFNPFQTMTSTISSSYSNYVVIPSCTSKFHLQNNYNKKVIHCSPVHICVCPLFDCWQHAEYILFILQSFNHLWKMIISTYHIPSISNKQICCSTKPYAVARNQLC